MVTEDEPAAIVSDRDDLGNRTRMGISTIRFKRCDYLVWRSTSFEVRLRFVCDLILSLMTRFRDHMQQRINGMLSRSELRTSRMSSA